MRRTTMSLTILFLALMMVQISMPFNFANVMPGRPLPVLTSAATMDPIPLNTFSSITFNSTYDSQLYSLTVSDPGQYSFNMSFIVDSAGPFPHVDFSVYLGENRAQYFPHLNDYIYSTNSFWNNYWWFRNTGFADTDYYEFVTIQPGQMFLEFYFYWRTPTDQLTVNFTFTEQFTFTSATEYSWDETQSTSWSEDDTWAGSKFSIPEYNLYNVSIYGELDYTTTAGWAGDAFFQPFDKLELMDGVYGENALIDFYNPWFNIPAGATSGTANWTEWNHYKIIPEDYYFFGGVGSFEFLNGSYITLEMTIAPISMPILSINQSVVLSFNSSLATNVAYLGITAPQGYAYNLYFDNRVGANWSVQCSDVYGWWVPPSYFYYEDASSYTTTEDRFENSFVYAMPAMGTFPSSGLTGETYYEMYVLMGSDVIYVNDSATGAVVASSGLQNAIDTFYFAVIANPFGGTPTQEFNITFNFEAYVVPLLGSGPNPLLVNQTIGPFYHTFALPVASGYEYEITAWSSEYTASGVAGVFIIPSPQGYLDWQWGGYYPLSITTPDSGIPFQVTNVNDTASIRFIATRHTTLYVAIMSISMSGPPPSDTTEVTVNMTNRVPTPYAIGTVVTESIQDEELTTYTTNLAAGTTYRISLSLGSTGDYAFLSLFDGNGFTPFAQSVYTLWAEVQSSYLNYTNSYTSLITGPVTIVLLGEGTVSFSIIATGEAPGSFMLGLIIGLIFMVAGVLIVFVVMRRRRF